MRTVILLFCIAAMTLALLWATYHTSLGVSIGGMFPEAFWIWLHGVAGGQGAESGHDRELALFAIIWTLFSTAVVLLIDRWLRRRRSIAEGESV